MAGKLQGRAISNTANVTLQTITVGNSASNTVVNSIAVVTPSVNVGSNVFVNTSTIHLGNSTVNTVIHTTGFTGNGAGIHGINASSIATGTLDTARLPATVNVSTAINVGANLNINTSAIFIGNSTVNTTIVAGNVNLQGTQLQVGNVIVNGNQLSVGNVTITDAQISVGNSTSNIVLGSTGVLSGNGSLLTSVNAIALQGNSVNDILTAANTAANTLASAAFTNAASRADSAYSNATSFASNADNISSGTLNNSRLPATVNVTSLNLTTAINVGANVTANATALKVGNSTVNTVILATGIDTDGTLAAAGLTTLTDVTITGNLTVLGNTSQGTVGTLAVGDTFLVLVANLAATNAPTSNAGITINRGSSANVKFQWDETNDRWALGNSYVSGNLTVTGDIQIDGNLVVSGTSVVINAASLAVEDNMIYLNNGSQVTHPDLGFAGNYNDGSYKHAGFFRDASDGVWKVYDGYTLEPDASAFIDTTNNSFRIADFTANVITANSFSGNGASVTSVNAATVGGNTASTLRSYSDTVSATAFTNAASRADSAYSNAVAYAASNSYVNSTFLPLAGGTLTGTLTVKAISANGGVGTTGQLLASNGTSTYWIDPPASTNVNAQYAWTNTHTFSNTITFGNSTVNTAISGATVTINGVNVNTSITSNAATAYTNAIAIAANATNLTSGTVGFARLPALYVGTTQIQSSSAAQAVSGITTLAAGNTTITGFANVSGNVYIGNSTVFWTANSTEIDVGTTSINTTVVAVGANVIANTTALFVGNSTVNSILTSTTFKVGGNTATFGTAAYVLANGSVGIGTASPLVKLDVVGDTYVRSGTFFADTIRPYTTNTLTMLGGGANLLYINGNLGVGNSAPGQRITVGGSVQLIDGNADGPQLILSSAGYTDWNIDNFSGQLRMYAGATSYFNLAANGNLGIGNTAPASKLRVEGITDSTGNIYARNGIQFFRVNSASTGLSYYNSTYSAWCTYMAATGVGSCGPHGNFTSPGSGHGVTSWALRNFIENSSGYGFTWETGTSTGNPTVIAGLEASTGNFSVAGTVTANSDERIKKNIRPIENALDIVKAITGVYYEKIDSGEKNVGVIAQQVEKVLPEVVKLGDPNDPDSIKSVAYGNMVGLLIEAIKEQQKQIEELKAKVGL